MSFLSTSSLWSVIIILAVDTAAFSASIIHNIGTFVGQRPFVATPSSPLRTRRSASHHNQDKNIMFEEDDCFDLCQDLDITTSGNNDNEKEQGPSSKKSFPDSTTKHASHKDNTKPSFQRMRLEMEWELRQNQQDCDVDFIETCGDFCVDCVGVGMVQCRFCHGEGKLHLPPTNLYGGSQTQQCPVCNQGGKEVCKACRGSGRIADFTTYSTSN